MEDSILEFKKLIVFCSNCSNVLDILNIDEEISYIDKNCECGSLGFYTQEITLKVKFLTKKPKGETPSLEDNGEQWYIKETD